MAFSRCDALVLSLAVFDLIQFGTVWLAFAANRPRLANDSIVLVTPGWLVAQAAVMLALTLGSAVACKWSWARGAERRWWHYLPLWPLEAVDVRPAHGRNRSLAFDIALPLRIGQLTVASLAAAGVVSARMTLLLYVIALPYASTVTIYALTYDVMLGIFGLKHEKSEK